MEISGGLLEAIRGHGAETYPEECCGALLGSRQGEDVRVERIERLVNAREGDRRRRYVVAPTEYAAAKSDVQRASDAVAKHAADLRALSAAHAAALDRAMAVLRNEVSRRADPATVRRLSDSAQAALQAAGGG